MKNIAKLGAILREWWKSGQILSNTDSPTLFDHPWIKEYLNRLFQVKKDADARLEKIIATAVVKLSMSKMGMSKEEALQAAREAVAFLRDIRAKKLFEEGKISEYGYEMYNRFIHSAWVKGAVKALFKNTGAKVKQALTVLSMKYPYVKKILSILKIVESVIPEDAKQKAKAKAKELITKAAEELPKMAESMIEQGYKVAKKVKEIVSAGIEKAAKKGQVFVERHPFLKNVIEGLKKVLYPRFGGPVIKTEDNSPFGSWKEKLKNLSLA